MIGPHDTQFDRDLALTDTDQPYVYEGSFDARWYIDRSLHGGHVISAVVRAFERAVADPERAMRSITVHYVRPARVGPYTIEVVIDRTGRSLSNARAQITQDGTVIASAMAALGGQWASIEWDRTVMPEVAPPEECPVLWTEGATAALHHNYTYRRAIGAAMRSGAMEPQSGGWLRLVEPRPVDAALAAGLADTWPPTPYTMVSTPIMFPTIELTVQLLAPLPLDGDDGLDPCLVWHRIDTSMGGYVIQDTEVWSRHGRLVARGRQHALLIPVAAG